MQGEGESRIVSYSGYYNLTMRSKTNMGERVFLVPLERTPRDWLLQILKGEPREPTMPKTKTLPQIIAAQVEKAIEAAGYRSQDEFANAVGIPRATLNRVLSGRFDNRISTLEKIASGLDLPIALFLTGDGSKKVKSTLHTLGPKKKSKIVVKIIVPKDEDAPQWLIDACREGAGQIEQEPAKSKTKPTRA